MNEWLHVGADALVLVAVSVTGFVIHAVRDSIQRVEEKTDENGERIARIEGHLRIFHQ